MPSMVIFGRRSLVGTDDFVFPGLLELLLRGIWLTVMSIVLNRYYQWTFSCVTGGWLVRVYLFGIVVMHSKIILLVTILMNRSAQGAIYDTKARRAVPYLLVLKTILLLPECALNALGTIWTYTNYIQCNNEYFPNTVVKIGVLFNWVVLGGSIFGSVMVIGSAGSLKLHKSTNGNVDMGTILHCKVTRKWMRIFRRWFCCLNRNDHSNEALSDVTGLIGSIFQNKDITPSDFSAGLILLTDKHSRECKEEIRRTTSIVSECFTGKPKWMSLKKARLYLQLSISTYDRSSSIFNNCVRDLCTKMPKFFSCTCFRTKPTAANEDILYASFVNHVFKVPFFVTADHETSSIVIAIRGSISVRDIFTDLTAVVEKLDAHGAPPDSYAHKGMLSSAKYIKSELEDHNVLEKAFTDFPEYNLVITGHSLGAGTAVLLGFYLRSVYPNLKVYSFSTPAALLSREAAQVAEEFTLSIGVGDDMVIHMTIDSIEDLLTNMIQVLQSCKLPKALSIRRHPKVRMYPPGYILHITKKKKSKEQKKADSKYGINSHKYNYEMRWSIPEDFKELRIMPRMILDHLSTNVLKTIDNVLGEQRNEE